MTTLPRNSYAGLAALAATGDDGTAICAAVDAMTPAEKLAYLDESIKRGERELSARLAADDEAFSADALLCDAEALADGHDDGVVRHVAGNSGVKLCWDGEFEYYAPGEGWTAITRDEALALIIASVEPATAQAADPVAINPRHQRTVTKAFKAIRTYHDFTNKIGAAENSMREDKRLERQAELAFDRFTEAFEDLPKREQNNLNRYHKAQYGYEV